MLYSTSELMTQAAIGPRDIAVLYGRGESDGETVLAFKTRPKVTVLDGAVRSVWAGGRLRLNYSHHGLARVLVEGGAPAAAADRGHRRDRADLATGDHAEPGADDRQSFAARPGPMAPRWR
jgi:hypothetical protein